MQVGTCDGCKHWSFVEPDWEFDELHFGRCMAIKMRETIIENVTDDRWSDEGEIKAREAIAKSKAIAIDASGYFACIRTAADFGCTLHEAKEAGDATDRD